MFGASHEDLQELATNTAIDYMTLITVLRDKGLATMKEISEARVKATALVAHAYAEIESQKLEGLRRQNPAQARLYEELMRKA